MVIADYLSDIIKFSPNCISIILIGNKNDLSYTREVNYEEANEFANSHEILYIECSALTGSGKEEIINIMILEIQKKLASKEYFDENKSIQAEKKSFLYRDDCC